ncbi:MAG: flagellar hook protein [Rhizobiales bacterium]|nr:flagellar hook protein [Hyphomicrobiales bacterium]MBO6697735.1 flagellar hook protein [Hyphomicrobiales bacterium]MBO6736010.1 flagellar hook protein [Hyphomicrobiales bacterium]MBO6912480.1 flagellar hook protein [Hyphomicrobiales bacterium]MBO6955111.1 flagellar hook protein [Hyphomicrobiales bacterium]
MSDVTLSSAVRSNLLSLQNTADMMSKTQERLATGLKVNSALDNPTNFFTASALNSRASDLGRLLDGVSNATQTLEAADNGISAITKLVESAQATARQALQTPSTIDVVGAATAGTATAGAFSALDITGGSSPAEAGTLTGTGFSALDLSGALVTGSGGTLNGAATGTVDLSGVNDLTISVDDGSGAQTITIDAAAVTQFTGGGGTVTNQADVTDAELANLINQELTDAGLAVTATVDTGSIRLTTDANGGTLTIGAVGGSQAANSGLNDVSFASSTNTGTPDDPADSISFDIAVDGGGTSTITIDAAAITQLGTVADDSAITGAELASLINQELTDAGVGATASFSGGELTLASDTTGASSDITISSYNDAATSGASGLSNATDTGAAAVAATDSISFDIAVDGGTATTVTIDDATVTAYNTANGTSLDSSALAAADVAALINDQVTGATAAVDGTSGNLTITSGTTGASSSVAITSYSATVASGSTGIADGTSTGADSTTTTSVNPERAEFVTQYNELMGQIDELAEDAGFNGVNLLDGDDLSVIFNEDGSSTLSITGVSFDATGLGLSQLGSTGLDADTDINAVLGNLDTAIGSLRSQASEFGSNLSIVETREDFTKSMINTLETGAANLTLADTNEEGANLLALQTRQQLSSTALSLASQADQNVLRLF